MLHLAHVDLEAVELEGTGLPRTGALIVFGDPDTERVEVVVEADSSRLVPADSPPGCPLLPEHRCVVCPTLLHPSQAGHFYDRTTGDPAAAARLVEFVGEFARADVLGCRSRLLGHPTPLQDDPAYRLATDEVPVEQWRLLLQLDPPDPDALFGDGGVFYVMVPQTDLRSGTVTSARGVFQCL
jgi:hypothetical protein